MWTKTSFSSSCNPGLKGSIETIECREYNKTHPVVRRRGAKMITFTGEEEFLDSLHSFPSNFPFSIKIANAYIRGGDRVKERYAGGKLQRPRISNGALQDLLKRNSNMMADATAEAEDRLADDLRRTDLASLALTIKTTNQTYTNIIMLTLTITLLPFNKLQDAAPRRTTPPRIPEVATKTVTDSVAHLLFPPVILIYNLRSYTPEGRPGTAGALTATHYKITIIFNMFLYKFLFKLFHNIYSMFLTTFIKTNKPIYYKTDLKILTKRKLYSGKMLTGHGIYPTGDSHEQRRQSWFSKSWAAPTAPEIRLGLGLGSTSCRGYSGITFNIRMDSARLFVTLCKEKLDVAVPGCPADP